MRSAGSIADDWTNSSSLRRELQHRGGRRVALERAIREAIRGGRLLPLDAIPSSRSLASELGIARGTVAEAYAQLAAEGYLDARPGSTTRVAAGAVGAAVRAPEPNAPPARLPLSLEVGVPDVTAFPRTAWIAASRRALASAPYALLALGDARGTPVLREMLASHLRRTRGVVADPGRIVITCGFSHGLAILCRAFRQLGLDAIAAEDPCLDQHRAIAAGAGLRVRALPVDAEGAAVPPRGTVRVALVTPAHQFPLGMTLAPARRGSMIAWAREEDAFVVEDDYDGEYRYDHQPLGALQGLDPERVVYAGTVSKTLAPALRLGWLVVPEQLVEPVTAAKELIGGEVSAVEQLTLAELIRSGRVRPSRAAHAAPLPSPPRRPDRPSGTRGAVPGAAGDRGRSARGARAAPGVGERDTLARAAGRGLALSGLEPFWHDARGKPGGLAIGYAAPPEHAWDETLAVLASVLSQGAP